MFFRNFEYELGPRDIIRVDLDRDANVRLFDDYNFARYRRRQSCQGFGGRALTTPYFLSPPHFGRWHLVIDLGGRSGTVRYNVQILTRR